MKRIIFFTILLFGIFTAYGQKPHAKGDRVKAAKVKYFNEKLELTPSEVKAFWPIYNDFDNRRKRIINEKKNLISYYKQNMENMSEEEITTSLEKFMELSKRESNLMVRYTEKFREILPDHKVMKIYIAEIEFRQYLLTRLRTGKPRM